MACGASRFANLARIGGADERSRKRLSEEILALPLEDQVIIAQMVWDHIEHSADAEIEQAWMEESECRWREIEEG